MVNLQFECLLVRKQLGVVRLKLNIFIQGLRVFLRQEVDGFLKLGQDINFPLLSGGEPGHDRPDRATREQKHEQILQYLEIHIKVPSNYRLPRQGLYCPVSCVLAARRGILGLCLLEYRRFSAVKDNEFLAEGDTGVSLHEHLEEVELRHVGYLVDLDD